MLQTGVDLLLATQKNDICNAVAAAVDEFCHDDVEMHDEEIRAGAPSALYKVFLLSSSNFHVPEATISDICKCLRHMFVCSDKVAYEVHRSGVGDELISILTQGAEKCLDGTWKDIDHDILEHSLAAIINICYVPSLKLELGTNFGLADLCTSILDFEYNDLRAIVSTIMADATVLYGDHSNLLELIIKCCDNKSFKVREIAAHGIWQFSARKCYKAGLAKNHFVRKALLRLLEDIHSGCRVNAATALFELAAGEESSTKLELVDHANGILFDRLVKVMETDISPYAKLYSARAIKHMISADTVNLITKRTDLLRVASSKADDSTEILAVKKEAVKILKRLVMYSNAYEVRQSIICAHDFMPCYTRTKKKRARKEPRLK
mmetsp:Transcript_25034/g.38717  ORF Transcript_25034/g.38717 Transcript_25034/m.38717 type:complete len:379 (-) Transcript_25034:124-1260(-)